jgi:hypothetical protein
MNSDSNSHLHAPNSPLPARPFELIYAYTRSQAVADGVQVEVSKVAAEAGIKFPVFLTRTVYDAYVTVPELTLRAPLDAAAESAI